MVSFRHYKSGKMIFYLDIFFNLTGILISGIFETEQYHLKITVCPRHRDLFGIRWRSNKSRCSIPTSAGIDAHRGKSSARKAQYGFKKGAFSLCYERHEYACTSRLTLVSNIVVIIWVNLHKRFSLMINYPQFV